MSEKVYCSECKLYKSYEGHTGYVTHTCRVKKFTIYNWHHKWSEYTEDPTVRNAANNCPDFEPRWWVRVREWFR